MCQVLGGSKSAYYVWLKGAVGARKKRRVVLEKAIEQVYFDSRQRYGSPRITAELNSSGIAVSRPTVAKIMRQMGLRSNWKKQYKPKTTDSNHSLRIAPNVLNRDFSPTKRRKAWVSDITYIPTLEGFLYLTVILDLYDRKVVGWSISEGMKTEETVLPAWYMASANYTLEEECIFHSDRGSQYAATKFRNVLTNYPVTQSMSRKGNCWDNAVAESFFKSLKTETIYGYKRVNKKAMEVILFEYIELWYNRKRRHSYIGNKTILELEQLDSIIFKQVA